MTVELGFAPGLEQERKPMTPEVLENFIHHNKVTVTTANLLDRCVDGRYQYGDTTDFAAIAKPGASAGDVVLAFGAVNRLQKQLPNQTILDTVVKSLGGIQNFMFHTDQKAVDAGKDHGMGCGHLRFARTEPDAYGVASDQMEFLFAKLPELLQQGASQIVLEGDHRETDVVVIDSEEFSLRPQRDINGQHEEVFVYQENLHANQLDTLAKLLQEAYAEIGEVVEESDIRLALDQAFAIQLGASLSRLANGYPVHRVTFNGDEIQIQ